MEKVDIFSIPLFRFQFENHLLFKQAVMPMLNDNASYTLNSGSNSLLQFTHAALHKDSAFSEFRNFVQSSLEEVMPVLGFEPLIQINSMWATRHLNGGSHHRHTHGNSFLAGVYYLSGTEENAGTTFYNVNRQSTQIIPARIPGKPLLLGYHHTEPFQEGTLIIFPAWLEHNTQTNQIRETKSLRHILSFNTMPVGKTNNDPFDRFNYLDASEAEMINSRREQVRD